MVPVSELEVLVTERIKDTERTLVQMQRAGLIAPTRAHRIAVWQWALHHVGTWMVYIGGRLQRSVQTRPALARVAIEPELCECD